MAKVQIKVW